jgi:hypothetical protein
MKRWMVTTAVAVRAAGAPAQTTCKPVMVAPPQKFDACAIGSNKSSFFVIDGGDALPTRHVVDASRSARSRCRKCRLDVEGCARKSGNGQV